MVGATKRRTLRRKTRRAWVARRRMRVRRAVPGNGEGGDRSLEGSKSLLFSLFFFVAGM